MMNVLRSMFGVCSSSAEKGEVHDTIRRVFGNELVLKDNTDKHNQRSKYVSHVRDNLSKTLDMKVTVIKRNLQRNTQSLSLRRLRSSAPSLPLSPMRRPP